MRYIVQILFIDSREEKRQVLIERDTHEAAERTAVEIVHAGMLRAQLPDCVEFIPIHRINLIRVVSEKD